MISPAGRGDAGAFLVRLLRLDPAALVRLRPGIRPPRRETALPTESQPTESQATVPQPDGGEQRPVELWGRLPFGVLVVRTLPVTLDTDLTVRASELLATLTDPVAAAPKRRDEQWRWPLPPSRGQAVERLPAGEVAHLARAASDTLREASSHGVAGRAVGERVIRDALLDHIAIVVAGYNGEHVDVPQRVVQAVVRMGFLGGESASPTTSVTFGDNLVTVRLAAGWIGLDASYGCAWYRPSSPLRMS
jgi:hypothetical protein